MFQRAELDQATAEDEEDRDDERPTVVVLKSGDLTEEEAEKLGAFPDPDPGKSLNATLIKSFAKIRMQTVADFFASTSNILKKKSSLFQTKTILLQIHSDNMITNSRFSNNVFGTLLTYAHPGLHK